MSTVIRKIIFIVFICSFYLSFSQKDNEQKFVTIYIDFKDKALNSYSIDKDSMSASFSIYIKGYESRKKREDALKTYNKRIGDPSSESFPVFSITFYTFLRKPEKIKSLNGIKYITVKEFRENNCHETSPTYIIHKLKDGTYLKWKTYTLH